MRSLKIPFPDISKYDKTRLIAPPGTMDSKYAAGALTLYVRNTMGFSAGDYMILDPFESEEAEIVRITSVDRAAHAIELVVETFNDHAVGGVVMKTPYNQTRIYKGTTTTVADHTIQDTIDLRPDNAYTFWNDETGTTTDYYSYTYYNSGRIPPYETTPRTLYTDSSYDCVTNVWDLKQNFMFGLDLTDDSGFPFPNAMFEFAIRSAVDSLEKTIGVRLKPYVILEERQDYYLTDYREYAFIQLNEYPIQSVEKVMIRYPSTPDITGASTVDIPSSWVQINKVHGQINLVPTYGSFSNMIMGMGGDYLSFLWRGWMGNAGYFPNLWAINYTAGFECGAVPYDVIAVVSKMACFYPLNIAGDLVGGIAIASKSIGIDGLSQSINTTSSPENAGYSARLRQYERELKTEIPRLVGYYKGMRMAVG
jgi:hypothetical protein